MYVSDRETCFNILNCSIVKVGEAVVRILASGAGDPRLNSRLGQNFINIEFGE